jgi:ABC-type Zn uptake system ZnuABC Zn-binding protein ZnuA
LLPKQKEYFQSNLENFENELDTILAFFRTKTEGKNISSFIIFHDAYNYLFDEL